MDEIRQTSPSAWRRIELQGVSRIYNHPRILDRRVTLADYDGPLRQLTVTDLGHDEPTLILTNQLTRSAAKLIGRYAQRMIVENKIEDGIDFFHMDALSSAVAMKVNCDFQLPLMASSLTVFWPAASVGAMSRSRPGTCFGISWMPQRLSRSPGRRSG
jgi:hypothetical protein